MKLSKGTNSDAVLIVLFPLQFFSCIPWTVLLSSSYTTSRNVSCICPLRIRFCLNNTLKLSSKACLWHITNVPHFIVLATLSKNMCQGPITSVILHSACHSNKLSGFMIQYSRYRNCFNLFKAFEAYSTISNSLSIGSSWFRRQNLPYSLHAGNTWFHSI